MKVNMKLKITATFLDIINKFNKIIPIKTQSDREYKKENINEKKNKIFFNSVIETAIDCFKKNKGIFNGFALAESSVRCFLYYLLLKEKKEYSICEFGGGQSTLFWNILTKYIKLKVITYEHDPEWSAYLVSKVNKDYLNINNCELMQVTEEIKKKMFESPSQAKKIWELNASKVDIEQYKNPILVNGFYNITEYQFPKNRIDAIILDGPHGNGRSLCFALFYDLIEKGTLILIDDYHHYPFLEDLSKIFMYEIIEKRNYIHSNKGWVILKIIDKTV